MSMQNNYTVWKILSKEEEKQIKKLGLKIDIDAYRSEKFKEEKKELLGIAKDTGIALLTYNPVSIESYKCLDAMGPATVIKIGTPDMQFSKGMPIPATEENREIIREIEKIIFKK